MRTQIADQLEIVVALRQTGALPVSRANRRCVENGSQPSDRLIPTRTVQILVAGNGAS